MKLSKFAAKCLRWYMDGFYTRKMLDNLLERGKLTKAEYDYIIAAKQQQADHADSAD